MSKSLTSTSTTNTAAPFTLNQHVCYVDVPADRILPHPHQPENRVRKGRAELMSCLRRTGVCQPLSLMEIPKRAGWYWNLDGNRRLAALLDLGFTIVPGMVLPKGTDIDAFFQSIQSKQPFTSKNTLSSFAKALKLILQTHSRAEIAARMRTFYDAVPTTKTRKDLEAFVALIGLRKAIEYGYRGTVSANIMTRLHTVIRWTSQMHNSHDLTDRRIQAQFVRWMIDTNSYKALGVAENVSNVRPADKQTLIDSVWEAFTNNLPYTVHVSTAAAPVYFVPKSDDVSIAIDPTGVSVHRD